MADEPQHERPAPPAPPWPPPWPTDADAPGFADAARQAWSEREAIYRLVYHLEARLDGLEKENTRWHRASEADRQAIRRQLGRHVDVLRTVQTRLNFVMVLMISVALFALAGPGGLYDIAGALEGRGLDADGIATLAGLVIPILYPLGRRIFLSVRPDLPRTENTDGH